MFLGGVLMFPELSIGGYELHNIITLLNVFDAPIPRGCKDLLGIKEAWNKKD